jgi:addiction module HigA family antidote
MPRPAIHPGQILRDELAELGVTPTELSRQIEVPPNRVTEIIHGRRSITGDTALRLGQWFGSSARFWLNLQSAYDLRAAEQRAGKEIERIKRRPAYPDVLAAKRVQAEARLLASIFGRKRPDASTGDDTLKPKAKASEKEMAERITSVKKETAAIKEANAAIKRHALAKKHA